MVPLLLLALTASAARYELVNDGCACDGSSESVGFQQGFVDGECWASTFVPDPAHYPFTVTDVTMLVGPSGTGTFDVYLYSVDASNEPDARLDGEAVQIEGSQSTLAQVDLAEAGIDVGVVTDGNLAVVVCLDGHDGSPAIARDADGVDHRDRSWIYGDIGAGPSWYQASMLGVNGDWIVRLGIETDAGGDTGDTGGGDTGGDDTGATDDTGGGDTGGGDSGGDTEAAALELYAISPASAAEGQAVNVVLSGAGFQEGADARIGGVSLTGTAVQDDGTISGRTPTALPAGVHDVEVENPDGTSAYLAAAFTVDAAEAGGCGCATGRGGGTGAWLAGIVVAGLAARRRR